MSGQKSDAKAPVGAIAEAQNQVDAYLGKHFPFKPDVKGYELDICCIEETITVPNESENARRSSVIMALAHNLRQMRDRHNDHQGCWSLNNIMLREYSKPELLTFLLETGSDKFLVMTAILFKDLKTELEKLIGEDRVADIEHWGCLYVNTVE